MFNHKKQESGTMLPKEKKTEEAWYTYFSDMDR